MSTVKRNITIEDLFQLKLLDTPEISPEGDRIVFTYKWTDLKANGYYSNLYMADLKEGKVFPFTRSSINITSRWASTRKVVTLW